MSEKEIKTLADKISKEWVKEKIRNPYEDFIGRLPKSIKE